VATDFLTCRWHTFSQFKIYSKRREPITPQRGIISQKKRALNALWHQHPCPPTPAEPWSVWPYQRPQSRFVKQRLVQLNYYVWHRLVAEPTDHARWSVPLTVRLWSMRLAFCYDYINMGHSHHMTRVNHWSVGHPCVGEWWPEILPGHSLLLGMWAYFLVMWTSNVNARDGNGSNKTVRFFWVLAL